MKRSQILSTWYLTQSMPNLYPFSLVMLKQDRLQAELAVRGTICKVLGAGVHDSSGVEWLRAAADEPCLCLMACLT